MLENAQRLRRELVDAGIRVKMDEREGMSPGFKFNDWEMRGVPLRLELGPKDVAKGSVVLARRDRPGKEGKSFVPQQGIAAAVAQTARRDSKGALRPRARVPQGEHGRARGLRRVQGSRREGLCFLLVVRRQRLRRKDQGRDEGDHALHSPRAARRLGQVHLLRPARGRQGHFREGILTRLRRAPRVYSSQTRPVLRLFDRSSGVLA